MKSLRNRFVHLVVLGLLCIGSAIVVRPAAAKPTVDVSAIWHPGTQLTTLTAGSGADQYPRYVDVEVWATSNTPFWSVQLACTVTPTVLQDYVYDGGAATGDPGDSVKMVQWGPAWGIDGTDYTQVPGTYDAAKGTLTTAAARLGIAPPIGSVGTAQSFLVATLHFQVKTVAGTSPLKCVTSFLDTNGNSVGAVTYTAPAPLTVIAGYTVSGSASYQARTTKSGIGINCFGENTAFPPTTTDSTGKFSITTRKLGNFTCNYFGNISSTGTAPHSDLYPWQSFNFRLNTMSYTLLPVVLRGGNVERTTTPDVIFPEDLVKITSNYNLQTSEGDANGDGKTNQIDLSITAGNYGFRQGYLNSHVLYGLARSWLGNAGPDNRIWLGEPRYSRVTEIGSSTYRDFWPTLSPDGSKIAFTRKAGDYSMLFMMNSDGSKATQLTAASLINNAYAPSWSPDGSRVAFNCAGPSAFFNSTNVCVVDLTGRNLQKWPGATVFPPAWLSNTQILFGGSCGTASKTICMIDLAKSPQVSEFSTLIDTSGGRTNDYPIVVPNVYTKGLTLFYRSITPSVGGPDNQLLYWANLPMADPPAQVMSNAGGFPLTLNTSYYTVSTEGNLYIMYYMLPYSTPSDCSGTSFYVGTYDDGIKKWIRSGPYTVDNAYCNPYWDGSADGYSYAWTERNTFNWVP